MMIQNAYGAQGIQTPGGGIVEMLLMLGVMFLIFYFFLIRPQQKRVKQHQEFLGKIQRGDEVITTGGLLGTVIGIAEKVMTLEVSENVRIKVLKSHIVGPAKGNV